MNNMEQKAFFQNCLYEALLKLMKQKSFKEISISNLCDTAGVSRMTFYRSYHTKEEILFQHLDSCFNDYQSQLHNRKCTSSYEIAYSFFEYWGGEEREFLTLIVKNGLSPLLVDKFFIYLETVNSFVYADTHIKPFVRSFLAGGLYQMLVDWIKDGMQTPIDEMAMFLDRGSNALTKISET